MMLSAATKDRLIWYGIPLVLGVICLGIFIYLKKRRDGFRYLGSVYQPNISGGEGELNEECLQHPGYRFCMLTDGKSGVCALSGMCVADMMVDHRQEDIDVPRPLCTKPIFKAGCSRFCECLKISDPSSSHTASLECKRECDDWFSPL